jgi:transketolase
MLAARELAEDGRRIRVVSMPCSEVFEAQPQSYRAHVLPDSTAKRIAIEAGAKDCWWRYVDGRGDVIGIDRFGQSAPAKVLFECYGFSVEAIVDAARRTLSS